VIQAEAHRVSVTNCCYIGILLLDAEYLTNGYIYNRSYYKM